MLQSIRESAQGWIAWAIVILISIPFALWGINSYLGVGGEPIMATVNDREITEREFDNNYQRFRSNLRQQLGAAFDPNLFDETQMRKDVLERMVRNELTLQAADRLGLGAGDVMVRETIANVPAFQADGRFDKAAYERVLRQQGFSPAEFEQQIRQGMLSDQLSRAISGSEWITQAELETIVRLEEQRREMQYLRLAADSFVKPNGVDDAQVQAYYEANPGDFMSPEQVKLAYLELNIANLSNTLEPDEESLKAFFKERHGDYSTPERRRASHILIEPQGEGDEAEAAAREKAEAVLARIRGGEDFAAVAKEVSQDLGSATQGGDLGFVESGMMDETFESALFGLAQDEISEPVRSAFGFHVIKLTELEVGSEKGFDEVREEVLAAYRAHEAERQFYEYGERLADLVYENADSLEPAAEALGLKVATTDWLDREGAGMPGGPKSMVAAFSEDVLQRGHNSELIELGAEHLLVLRALDHKEATIKPLDEVKAEITARLLKQQGSELAREMGKTLLERLRQGESLEQVAEGIGHRAEQPGSIGRNEGKLDLALVQTLFSLPRPEGERPQYGLTELNNGDTVIVALHKVEDGSLEKLDARSLENRRLTLERSRGRDRFRQMVDNLRAQADVTITQ
jgi:peptidyl-prolyl cis-trans isomerase D